MASATRADFALPPWTRPEGLLARRRPLDSALIVPRPEQPLRIGMGTGGSPGVGLRAVELGLPMFLGILGGTPERWAQYVRAYRDARAQVVRQLRTEREGVFVGGPSEVADRILHLHQLLGEVGEEELPGALAPLTSRLPTS
jgi:alkanesulfonate monooxygenase SsuD/methylene tetrahydromethanopterin reductase-like flavin-dependent oxidoreductase (luciferase family)